MLPFLTACLFCLSVFFAFSNSDLRKKRGGRYLIIAFVLTSEIEICHLIVHHFFPLVICS